VTRKLFIVKRGNEPLFAVLRKTLANEPDVEIFYDRRAAGSTLPRSPERRTAVDVALRIRNEGFVVARPAPPPRVGCNVRWA